MEAINIIAPEISILIAGLLGLIVGLFWQKKYIFWIVNIGLWIAAALSFISIGEAKTIAYNGLFIRDDLSQWLKIFICIIISLNFFYATRYIKDRDINTTDYYVLAMFSTIGMLVLVSAHSLLSVYLALELLSLPLYAMTAMRRTSSDGSEAAMKYFVMGAIASAMLLYGMSLIYGLTGKLDILNIANALGSVWPENKIWLSCAVVLLIAGVGFKLAAFPFHMWAPDVYQGAPTAITLFISTAPKIAAIGMAFRLFIFGLEDIAVEWQQIVLILALLSTGFGNLFALVQTNLKRLFAYSAISHMGYALFGILTVTKAGYAASMYYVLIYALMTAAAFGLLTLLSRNEREIEYIDQLKGLNQRSPWLALMLMIVLFSMAGVPPTVGFFIKLLVLKALIDVHMTWVAVLGLIFAVIGAFYYIRIIKVMYFDAPEDYSPIKFERVSQVIFSGNCLALLYLGLFPNALLTICQNALIR